MKLIFSQVNSKNQDFIDLVKNLDNYLSIMDGEEHSFYSQYNKLDKINHVIIVYDKDKPISCGAIKELDKDAMEVKRMYTIPEYRGKGIASKVLQKLEEWSKELGYKYCVLETGIKQIEANKLYIKNGYSIIPNYDQYIGVENSICYKKSF